MLHLHHIFHTTLLYLMKATIPYLKTPCHAHPFTNQLLGAYERLPKVMSLFIRLYVAD